MINNGGGVYMHINKLAVGHRLRDLRLAENLSMATVAEAVGVASKSTVNDWEKGRTLANHNRLAQLAALFKTSQDYLLYGELTTYAQTILRSEGINDPEFNVLLWEYVDLTTTNPNLLSGEVFATATTTQPDTTAITDNIIDTHIATAIAEILPAVVTSFSTKAYPSATELIKSACGIFRQRIQLLRRTFTGKYNRIVRLLDNVDLYEKLGTDAALRDYLDTMTDHGSFELDKAYQTKMNALITDFHQQLNALNSAYQAATKQPTE